MRSTGRSSSGLSASEYERRAKALLAILALVEAGMTNPYRKLPPAAFWRTAVAERRPRNISDLWSPKYPINKSDRIATFGSCFAQHMSRSLVMRNYDWFDAEQPHHAEHERNHNRGYGIFSARTGNIYTAAALRQWVAWSIAEKSPPDEVWEIDGRYYDPFRPTIEPSGFSSQTDLFASRGATLRAFRDVIERANLFIFTLGLTEAWIHREGYTYAVCPGTGHGGQFDPAKHSFKNFDYSEIVSDMEAILAIFRQLNGNIRILLTVSPVPLTATASGKHVLVATTHSKSILRAVAGHLSETHSSVDYFPSYEIITGTPFRARSYESNLRTVTQEGVDFVMQHFFEALNSDFLRQSGGISSRPRKRLAPETQPAHARNLKRRLAADLVCEEITLDAFATTDRQEATTDPDAARVCIIGNSHAAALQQALRDGHFVDPKMDVVMWAFAGRSYDEIKLEDGEITHPNRDRALLASGGRFTSINPKDFDALVFVGAGLKPGHTLAKLKQKQHGNYLDLEALKRIFSKRHAADLMRSAANICPGKTFFVPSPLISEASGEFGDLKVGRDELDQFNDAVARVLAEDQIIFIAQPPETIRENKWTKREFSTARDFKHTNGRYGELLLRAIRDRLHQ